MPNSLSYVGAPSSYSSWKKVTYLGLVVTQVADKELALLREAKLFIDMTPPVNMLLKLFSRFSRKFGTNSAQENGVKLADSNGMFLRAQMNAQI